MKAYLVACALLTGLLFTCAAQAEDTTTLAELESSNSLHSGFVGILHDEKTGKTYLKINNIGEEFIYLSSLPHGLGSNDIGLDRGQLSDNRLVEFERAGNKLFLKQKPTYFRANTDNLAEANAVQEAFASSILWGFAIVDSGSDWALVDASEFVLQDIHGVGRILAKQKQGKGYKVDGSRSAIDLPYTKSFPDNTEIQATITLLGTEPGSFVKNTVPDPHAITLKMRHSFVRLPKDGYKPRLYLPKSGYWSTQYRDYAKAINEDITQKYIGRHRLEKKDPNAEQSHAVNPIVYYLDPGVPEPVRSALLDGARWWNTAFTNIGYKDAFQVKILPQDADPMDVRYNVIQWVHRSTRGWSYGRSVTDPRTGEIIKGHVTLGSLRVRQDYLIAQGMMAPFSTIKNDQPLMDLALARLRQLSAHEIGHTIGLNHNFAASSYGRESVMDYPAPRFELDSNDPTKVIAPKAYGVGLGKWDMATIAYGYQDLDKGTDELTQLKKLIELNDRNGLLHISDPDSRSAGSAHADASLWDNGEDAAAELTRMIEVRKVAISNFGIANLKTGRDWSDLEEVFVPVYYSTRFQIHAAAKLIGGLRYEYGVKGENSPTPKLTVVDVKSQEKALETLLLTLEPSYLSLAPTTAKLFIPKAVGSRRTRESVNGNTGVAFDQIHLATASAQHTLGLILNPERLARIIQQHARNNSSLSIEKIGSKLHNTLISTKSDSGIELQIRKATADLLISNYVNLLHDQSVAQPVKMKIYAQLLFEKTHFEKALRRIKIEHPYHTLYSYQLKRLDDISLEGKNTLIDLPKMPPGSPI